MVTITGNTILKAQVANAFNQETAQCLNATNVTIVTDTTYLYNHSFFKNSKKQNKNLKNKKENKNLYKNIYYNPTEWDCEKFAETGTLIFYEKLCLSSYTRFSGYWHPKLGYPYNVGYNEYVFSNIDDYLTILIRLIMMFVTFMRRSTLKGYLLLFCRHATYFYTFNFFHTRIQYIEIILLCYIYNFITKNITYLNFVLGYNLITDHLTLYKKQIEKEEKIDFSKFRLQAGDSESSVDFSKFKVQVGDQESPSWYNENESHFEQDYRQLEEMYMYIEIEEMSQHDFPIYKPNKSQKKNKPRDIKRYCAKMDYDSFKNLRLQSAEEESYSFDVTSLKQNLFEKFGASQQTTYFIHVCESIGITAHYLSKATCKADVLIAFANLTKHHLKDRTLCSSENLKKINKLINTLFKRQMELQSSHDELLFTLRNLLNNYQVVKKSPVFKKVFRLFNYFLALEIFQKCGLPITYSGYNKLEQEIHKKKYHLGPDFVFSLLDTTLFLCERGSQCWRQGSIEPMFHSGSSNAEWFDKTTTIKRQAINLHNPVLNEVSESEFLSNLDEVIEKGQSIYKFASMLSDFDKKMVNERLNDMLMIKSEILCLRFANESRQVPFSVLLHGESGIGKSTVKDILYYVFCETMNLPNTDDYKYNRNPISDFWDGFRSSMHSLFLDDVGFMHPNKAPNGDKSCLEFIQVINPMPFVPNQASLDLKGKTPFRGKFVCATTNVKNLNSHHYFSHPSAVQRRFPFIITPTPKPEYTTEGMLDSKKVPPAQDDQYDDLWTYSVERVYTVPIGGREVNAKIVADPELQDMNQKQFLKWYISAIKQHFDNQNKMTNSIKMMKEIKSCKTCSLPLKICDCNFQCLDTLAKLTSTIDSFLGIIFFFKIWAFCMRFKRNTQQTREYYTNLGNRINGYLDTPKFFAFLASIITGAIIIWKLKTNLMSMQAAEGERPTGNEEKENPWYKNDYEITNFDISRQTLSWKDMEIEQLIKVLANNTMTLIQYYKTIGVSRERYGNALAIEGHKVIVNLHTLKMDEEIMFFTIIRQSSADGVTQNISFQMKRDDIQIFSDHDIAVLNVTQLPPFKRITNLFPNKDFNGSGKGFIMSKRKDGTQNKIDFIRAKRTNGVDFSHFDKNSKLVHDVYTGQVDTSTLNGDCGAPYILLTPMGPVLLGIHVAGYDAVAQCLFFDKETIELFIANETKMNKGTPMISSKDITREVGPLAKKSVFRYIQSGSATIYGSFSGFKITPKTRVEKTPMNAFLQEHGYSTKFTQPVMGGWKPWRIAALDLVNPVVDIDLNTLNIITEQFTETILKQLPQEELDLLSVYDDFTALNGAAGITYVDKMNRNTSAGNPWKKSKKFFLTAIAPEGDNLDPVEASPEILERMKEIIEKYKNGERAHPNFCAHLKDEPVTFAKQKVGKTRVFSGAPFDWSLVVRKYFLSSIRVIQRNKFIFEAAPGTICQSHEWGDIYRYLTTFGTDRIVAGDYKAYDKRMPPAFIIAAFKIMISICKKTGKFDEEDVMIMQGIAEDTAYPLTDFNGDLVEFYGSNPSGHPLTVIINSLVNSLYLRYVYYMMNPKSEVLTFCDNVKLMTYGDDNIMGVSPNVPWFNHTTIQENLSTMGITYTMADKISESVPYIDIKDSSFLKRTWRFNPELEEYLCPLEHESIEKSMMVWTRSKTVCWEEQCLSIVSSAIREYFFYGRSVYEKRSKLLQELINHLNINEYVMYDKNGQSITFPTFDALCEQFRKAGH